MHKWLLCLQSYPFINCREVYYFEGHQVSREEYMRAIPKVKEAKVPKREVDPKLRDTLTEPRELEL